MKAEYEFDREVIKVGDECLILCDPPTQMMLDVDRMVRESLPPDDKWILKVKKLHNKTVYVAALNTYNGVPYASVLCSDYPPFIKVECVPIDCFEVYQRHTKPIDDKGIDFFVQ